MLEEFVAQPHCTHILVKVAIKYVYTIIDNRNVILNGFLFVKMTGD